ncbi:Metalloregulator ArsR/SmtB family transcription factor [Sulfidibacter corallicola]|uniref:Metalloregulator ArsR/SmtB family transcription factor n=1 Tax=Sulfidibacter corallicola TaxID=2818388 RepID=A0A8A4THB0_SULCO|nr:metalloregulator ArsR/SmtB family transcription factor [Sulfidibacter corallicola]QTD48940.1 metalloregulator ArsR/SmtB family transcription factor [Sulfidibacter corallicola]
MSTPQHNPQTQIHDEIAELARTLGHAHRLVLLDHITQEECAVETLAERSGLSVANASQHLQRLRRVGLVQTRRAGKYVLYRLGDGPIVALLAALRHCADHNQAQMRQVVTDVIHQKDHLQTMPLDVLLERMKEGSVTLLDVRPEHEYATGHLPGALNIPCDELERRLAELPPHREIVAYCRGPFCALSLQAVAALRGRGLRARHLESGIPGWKAAGLDLDISPQPNANESDD